MSTASGTYLVTNAEYLVLQGIWAEPAVPTIPKEKMERGRDSMPQSTLTAFAIAAILATSGTHYTAQYPIHEAAIGFSATPSHFTENTRNLESDKLQEKFTALATQWRDETGTVSSTSKIVMNPSYQAIMAMGEKALPYILRDLQQSPDHWFYALRLIADESPVKAEDMGDMGKMADSWIEWGFQKGYLS